MLNAKPIDQYDGPFNTLIAERMRELDLHGLEAFAQHAQIGYTTLYNLVLGRQSTSGANVKPSVDTLAKLSWALKKPLGELVYLAAPDAYANTTGGAPSPNPEPSGALVLNLFGGPGTGKSTTAAATFAELKYRGINTELATEYVKAKVWEKHHALLNDQLYILAKQHRRIATLLTEVDIVVTDAPILLSLIYAAGDQPLEALVLDRHARMDTLNVLLKRVKTYNPAGRTQTEDQARELDQQIQDALDQHKIPYVQLPAIRETVPHLAQLAVNHLKRRQAEANQEQP